MTNQAVSDVVVESMNRIDQARRQFSLRFRISI